MLEQFGSVQLYVAQFYYRKHYQPEKWSCFCGIKGTNHYSSNRICDLHIVTILSSLPNITNRSLKNIFKDPLRFKRVFSLVRLSTHALHHYHLTRYRMHNVKTVPLLPKITTMSCYSFH